MTSNQCQPQQPRRHPTAEHGSLLVTAAVGSAVISILVGGMLSYIRNEMMFETRAHRWNQALHLAEAGIEIGFAEINHYFLSGQNGFSSSRDWFRYYNGQYGRYTPVFTNAAGQNEGLIYTYVNGVGTSSMYLFCYGGCPVPPNGDVIYRGVEARLGANGLFPAGLASVTYIDLKANNCYVDSYDSGDPTKSTDGLYDPTKRQTNGDVVSNDTVTNTVDVTIGNTDIYGEVWVGPSGSVSFGPNGSIGTNLYDRAESVAEALADGSLRTDLDIEIPPARLPSGAENWLAIGTINAATTLNSGDYKASTINLSGSGQLLTISGHVRLYVTGIIDLTGNGGIVIQPNSSLQVYVAGNIRIAGNAVVNNSVEPTNCLFYGLPTCTSVVLNGNGSWIGGLYAPNANLVMNGGGSTGQMSGSVVAYSISLNGSTQFHYDEALGQDGPISSYDIRSWISYRWTGQEWVRD